MALSDLDVNDKCFGIGLAKAGCAARYIARRRLTSGQIDMVFEKWRVHYPAIAVGGDDPERAVVRNEMRICYVPNVTGKGKYTDALG